jgi:hypothetical protein
VLDSLSFTTRTVAIGGPWVLRVLATDTDSGVPAAPTLTATVTLPDGTTTSATVESTTVSGVFRATVTVEHTGRHLARVSDGVDVVDFVAMGVPLVDDAGMPDVPALDGYLGDHSWSDDDLQQALDQETSAQWRVCRVPAAYPADLRGALLRRAQRSLALRAISLGMIESENDRPSMVPGKDPEVRRLEAPWRKLAIG